jgi:hypothetical protein
MKKLLIISTILSILLFSRLCTITAMAKEPVKDYPQHAKQVKQVLEETIKFPGCSMKHMNHGEAVVVFSIKDNGMIEIDEITANCKTLEKNLRDQLSGLYFKDVIHPYNQHYRVKFTFLYC